jgi:hypothetical protein
VTALIRWGKFQTGQSGDDAVENLRRKILPGLQKIRFSSLTQLEVAQLCEGELKEVLTAEEKYSILNSSIRGDWKKMPTGVVSSSKLAPRHGPYTFCPLPYVVNPSIPRSNRVQEDSILCTINKQAVIVGVKLNLASYHKHINFSLHDDGVIALAEGNTINRSLCTI